MVSGKGGRLWFSGGGSGFRVRVRVSGQWEGEVGVALWEDAARPTLQGGRPGPLCELGGSGEFGWGWGEELPTKLVQAQVVQAQVELHVVSSSSPANAAHGYVYRVGVGAWRADLRRRRVMHTWRRRA